MCQHILPFLPLKHLDEHDLRNSHVDLTAGACKSYQLVTSLLYRCIAAMSLARELPSAIIPANALLFVPVAAILLPPS